MANSTNECLQFNLECTKKYKAIDCKSTDIKSFLYTMDGKPDRWKVVYYPLYQDGRTQEYYDEPRALVQNIDKPGFWHKEVPLRYLQPIQP